MSGALGFQFDPDVRTITYKAKGQRLNPGEATVLALLLRVPGSIVTREHIEFALWGNDPDGGPEDTGSNIAVRISRIRHKLRAIKAPVRVMAVHSTGYFIQVGKA